MGFDSVRLFVCDLIAEPNDLNLQLYATKSDMRSDMTTIPSEVKQEGLHFPVLNLDQ